MPDDAPKFKDAVAFWWKLGWISFGGPAGQIAMLHQEIVERRKWLTEAQFLHGLNFCMMLPGPEAQQLVTYVGWRLHGALGGIVAGTLFILPGALVLWILALVYVLAGETRWVTGILSGIAPAVLAIIVAAVIRIGSKTLKHPVLWAVAAAAFCALFFFQIYFPAVVLSAGMLGWGIGKWIPGLADRIGAHGHASPSSDETRSSPPTQRKQTGLPRWLRVLAVGLAVWWIPVALCGFTFGWSGIFVQIALFFSQAALVTFGGAYAVLPFVAQEAVYNYGWLRPEEMMAGLALAESTPGPLIMVLQFVGFLAAWNAPGDLPPLLAATLGAAITTWVTFVPCFLFIFLGAPFVERVREIPALSSALTVITAAVVGVILNLAAWFGIHSLIDPEVGIRWGATLFAAACLFAILRWKWSVATIVAIGAMVGLGASLLP